MASATGAEQFLSGVVRIGRVAWLLAMVRSASFAFPPGQQTAPASLCFLLLSPVPKSGSAAAGRAAPRPNRVARAPGDQGAFHGLSPYVRHLRIPYEPPKLIATSGLNGKAGRGPIGRRVVLRVWCHDVQRR
jgi:hypothetical protein